jgi:hypothetical protein
MPKTKKTAKQLPTMSTPAPPSGQAHHHRTAYKLAHNFSRNNEQTHNSDHSHYKRNPTKIQNLSKSKKPQKRKNLKSQQKHKFTVSLWIKKLA